MSCSHLSVVASGISWKYSTEARCAQASYTGENMARGVHKPKDGRYSQEGQEEEERADGGGCKDVRVQPDGETRATNLGLGLDPV